MRSKSVIPLFIALLMMFCALSPFEIFAGNTSKSTSAASKSSEDTPKLIISHESIANADKPGLFLEQDVWGIIKNEDALEVLQHVFDIYSDLYGGEYIVREVPHTLIQYAPVEDNVAASVSYDMTIIKLSATDDNWQDYIKLFGHELYHYTTGVNSRGQTRHQWFEEAICTVHSLYVLDVLSEKWETDVSFRKWERYAAKVREHFDFMFSYYDFGMTGSRLADLYKDNRAVIEDEPHALYDSDRSYARNLATVLYRKVFEDNTDSWTEALKVLHTIGNRGDLTFEEYLNKWYSLCEREQRAVVKEIADILEIRLK